MTYYLIQLLAQFLIAALGVSGLGLVVLVPYLGCFMWPLDVAGVSCRYLSMAAAVSPGHFLSWLLCTAFSSIGASGLSKL